MQYCDFDVCICTAVQNFERNVTYLFAEYYSTVHTHLFTQCLHYILMCVVVLHCTPHDFCFDTFFLIILPSLKGGFDALSCACIYWCWALRNISDGILNSNIWLFGCEAHLRAQLIPLLRCACCWLFLTVLCPELWSCFSLVMEWLKGNWMCDSTWCGRVWFTRC